MTDNNVERTIDFNSLTMDSRYMQYSLPMGITKDVDTKYLTRFIKQVERMVRSNKDYKLYLESLREVDLLSRDAFFINLTSDLVEIQLHHFPFTLFNICRYVVEELFKDNELISTFMVADKVIKYHLNDQVGLVALSTTTHEIEHARGLPITEKQIYGDWESLEDEFTLNDQDKHKIELLRGRKILNLDHFNHLKGIDPMHTLENLEVSDVE